MAAAKLSGVAALKDIEKMKEAGAVRVLSFIDCGFPSTVDVDEPTGASRTYAAESWTDRLARFRWSKTDAEPLWKIPKSRRSLARTLSLSS